MGKCGLVLAAALVLGLCFSAAMPLQAKAAEETDSPLVSYWSSDPGVTEMPVAEGSTETYAEEDRMWQGLPTIAVTPGGRMWCAWQTGDSVEGSAGSNNYDVLYYSDDMGKTWSEDYMIWDVPDDSIRLTDPRLFYDQYGKLWLVLIRGGLNGVYAMQIMNPDCDDPATELEVGEPIAWMRDPPAHRPTILSNGYWITPVEVSTDAQKTYICNPDDENGRYRWTTNTQQAAITAYPDDKSYGEAQIIELEDGRLMMLSRLPGDCGGGMEISYSTDYGATWSAYQADNGVPYITPNSKFHIQRLESGAILLITHATTDDREQLAAYLSYDDGETWPYMLMLDDTDIRGNWRNYGVSYPEAAAQQGENGEIYIVYDAGRYELKEIRMCIITEEDIKAGKPVSEYCSMRMSVSKLGGYLDYVDTQEEYEQYMTVEPGTPKSEILQALSTTVTLIGEDGTTLALTGEWECLDYAPNIEGRYTFEFSEQVTGKAQDLYSLLKVYVTVGEEEEIVTPPDDGGDDVVDPPAEEPDDRTWIYVVSGVGAAVVIAAAVTAAVLLKRKKSASRKKNPDKEE